MLVPSVIGCRRVPVPPGEHAPADEIYLAAALEAEANLVVSLDPDLLRLGGRLDGSEVIEPERLVELLDARKLGAPG